MLKMIKYMKKSFGAVFLILLLLVLQAACDLSLPQYTSNIVNVGIQQGGIENAVPEAIRQSEMEKLFIFMSDSEKEEVLSDYTLLDKANLSQEELDSYSKDYSEIKNENIYKLDTKDESEINSLNNIFGKPMMLVMSFESDSDDMKAMREQMMGNMSNANMGQMNGDIDMFKMLLMMPKAQVDALREKVDEKLKDMPDSMITQAAVSYVKNEYNAIGIDTEKLQNNYVLMSGAKMLGLALLSLAATISVAYLGSRVAARLGRDLRSRVFNKVVSFSNTEFDKFSTASLITRSTNDIQQIQQLMVMLLRIVFYAPILGIGGVIKVLNTDTSMAWIIGVAVLVIISIVLLLFGIVMPKFKIVQKLVDKVNLVMRERLTGLMVIRAFSTEKHEEDRFDDANKDLTRTNLFVNRVLTGMLPMMMLVMNIITLLIVWNGSKAVDNGVMQVGDMMAFIQYTMQIIMAFLMISMVSIILPRASVSANRIEEVLSTDVIIKDIDNVEKFDDNVKGMIEFKNVSFRYPNADEDVLTDISFTAEPGKTTAFIGSTGSGKSTLINLIPRFYDVTGGEILIDGKNVKDVSQHDLREKIGYVPQKGMLFSGTIESNLKYGKQDATESEVAAAADVSQAIEFINSKPDGFNTEISQGGSNVSGGQKQRLSIARAITKNPEIYIFDDSFSALDFKTDAALRKALKHHTGNSTVIIVAQRISTIFHADEIIVLDEGRIVGKGTHKELLKNCEVYRQIALSQLSKEELENE